MSRGGLGWLIPLKVADNKLLVGADPIRLVRIVVKFARSENIRRSIRLHSLRRSPVIGIRRSFLVAPEILLEHICLSVRRLKLPPLAVIRILRGVEVVGARLLQRSSVDRRVVEIGGGSSHQLVHRLFLELVVRLEDHSVR